MQTTSLPGFELAFEVTGPADGAPVLLIHGGVIADTFKPMSAEPALAAYRIIRHHRRGYGASGLPPGAATLHDQAADAACVLDAAGADRAHVVGHSAGGAVALQLAVDAPERVMSLSLLEPYLVNFLPGAVQLFFNGLAPVVDAYAAGDVDLALDLFSRFVFGERGRDVVAAALPDARALAAKDLATVIEVEMPAALEWGPDDVDPSRVTCPVLSMMGAETDRGFQAAAPDVTLMADTRDLILRWFPDAADVVLPRLNHLLMIEDPAAVAGVLADFFAGRLTAPQATVAR